MFICFYVQFNLDLWSQATMSMKTLTFFNEKGGSGKSTFCLMMASWLRYKVGARVAVLDLDDPMHSINELRQVDLDCLRSSSKELLRFVPQDCVPERDWYPVIPAAVDGGEKDQLMLESLVRSLGGDYDYVLVDFGGSFSDGDAVIRFMRSHLLDLMVIPVYSDETVLLSALELCYRSDMIGQRKAVFWNRVTRSERPDGERDRLRPLSDLFTREGHVLLDTIIPDLVMFRRDPRTWRFIRSTACWPQQNVDAICPDLESLFSEVLSLLENRKQ